MERKFYTNDFEQLLKDKTDEFRMYPSKRVWHSIYNDLHPGRKWPSIAVSMVLVIVLLMMGYWNNNSSKAPALTAIATTPKNTTTITAKANVAAHNIALQQAAISPIAYQNQTTIQQPFGIYKNNTEAKPNSSLIAANKNALAQQPAINWNIALGQFNNIASTGTITNTSLLNNSTLFSISGVDNKNNTRNTETPDEFDNAVALQQTENSKPLMTTSANSKSKTAVATDKRGGNKNAGLLVNTDKNNTDINSAAGNNNADKVDDVTISSATAKTALAVNKKATAEQDKAFIDNYAFYNKSKRKKWQDRTALEFYITPSVGYRHLTNDAKYNPPPTASFAAGMSANESVNQKPGLGVEAGLDIIYSLAKNLRVKAGVQINYTNYAVTAEETSHPVLTTLTLTNPNTGFPDLHPATTTLANTSGPDAIKIHNKTYQFSLPIGAALKLSGNNKLEWYAGATIQPTFVIGGKAYLLSSDRKNYVADASLIRKWNVNSGIETYISYKFDNFTLQAGPQVRYQLFSTYSTNYTVTEKLYNVGVKIGILKNF